MKVNYRRWQIEESDLAGLDCKVARDLIIRCFFEAQKESIARGKKALDLDADDASIMQSVEVSVQMAFEETGGDYHAPDKPGLLKVVEFLALKAKSWGTPEDIIEHHKGQMQSIFERI